MFKKGVFLRVKHVHLKYVLSKAQINNTDYHILDTVTHQEKVNRIQKPLKKYR